MSRKLAGALVAPLILFAACASEGDPGALVVETGPAAVQALRAVPDAAAEARTAAFEMVIAAGDGGETLEIVATGAFDASNQRLTMEMDLGAAFADLAEATDETLPPGMDEPMQVVADGSTVYLRLRMLDALTGTSGWLSATPEDLGQGDDALGLGANAYDPTAMLDVLRGTEAGVEAAGQEDVRGVPTTRYTATVSLDDALTQVPAEQREALEGQLDRLGGGEAAIPVEVWVDAEGLPRRLAMSLDEVAAGVGAGGAVRMTIEFFDYGEPVRIEVPSPDEVTPFAEALGGFAGAFSEGGS